MSRRQVVKPLTSHKACFDSHYRENCSLRGQGRVSHGPLLPWPCEYISTHEHLGWDQSLSKQPCLDCWNDTVPVSPSDVPQLALRWFLYPLISNSPVSQRWTRAAWSFPVVPSIHPGSWRFHLPCLSFNQFVPAAQFSLRADTQNKTKYILVFILMFSDCL